MILNQTLNMDAMDGLKSLPNKSINCVATSPPYYNLRKYSKDDREFGCVSTPEEYVDGLCDYCR